MRNHFSASFILFRNTSFILKFYFILVLTTAQKSKRFTSHSNSNFHFHNLLSNSIFRFSIGLYSQLKSGFIYTSLSGCTSLSSHTTLSTTLSVLTYNGIAVFDICDIPFSITQHTASNLSSIKSLTKMSMLVP